MDIRWAVLISLGLLCSFCSALSFEDRVENAYFEGRSGEIILQNNQPEENSHIFLLNSEMKSKKIKEVEVADLLSHIGGYYLPLASKVDRDGWPEANLFSAPKAILLYTLTNVTKEEIKTMPFLSKYKATTVEPNAYAEDSIAKLTTMISGVNPDHHGIIAANWPNANGVVSSYISNSGLPDTINFPTLIANSYNGKNLVLSASSSYPQAAALNVHRAVIANKPHFNSFTISWTGDGFTSWPASDLSLLNQDQLSKALSSGDFVKLKDIEFVYYENPELVEVQLRDGPRAKYSLSATANLLFFAELKLAASLTDSLKNNEGINDLINDDISDFISFSFASLDGIRNLYGSESIQMQVALRLVDKILENLSQSLPGLYDGNVASVVLAVSSKPKMDLTSALRKKIIDSPYVVLEHFESYLPSVYLLPFVSENEHKAVCESLQAQRDAVCKFAATSRRSYSLRQQSQSPTPNITMPHNTTNNGTNPSPGLQLTGDQVAEFQIILWSAILIAIIILSVAYCMFSINNEGDTILFRLPSGPAAPHPHSN